MKEYQCFKCGEPIKEDEAIFVIPHHEVTYALGHPYCLPCYSMKFPSKEKPHVSAVQLSRVRTRSRP